MYFQSAGLKLKQPFSVTDGEMVLNFRQDESFNYLDGGLKAGYFLVRSERVHLAPYMMIGGSTLQSKRFDTYEDSREYKVINSFAYGPGLHTEFRITKFRYPGSYAFDMAYFSIKAEGGYNFIVKAADEHFTGNAPYFTIAALFGFGYF